MALVNTAPAAVALAPGVVFGKKSASMANTPPSAPEACTAAIFHKASGEIPPTSGHTVFRGSMRRDSATSSILLAVSKNQKSKVRKIILTYSVRAWAKMTIMLGICKSTESGASQRPIDAEDTNTITRTMRPHKARTAMCGFNCATIRLNVMTDFGLRKVFLSIGSGSNAGRSLFQATMV
ncbi:unnamed protein product [Phytophthora fragariaefolia]|uniref:Unnamed protein product n=1 Tax=Phytophthora fragariaefolia TaxID=1490495 RepID=A0A9W6X118_9STRA|nr:unnamed protein product [Phytophthora fragariaefolia]